MDRVERANVIGYLGSRYRRAGKAGKGEILRELEERLGFGRRQARRLLSPLEPGRPRKPDMRGRPSKYGDIEFKPALKGMWRTTRYMCSKHLRAALPEWIDAVDAERGAFAPDIRERLLSISAPTIDRILKPYKALKGKSLTRSGSFREQSPIQENIWDIN